MLSSVVKFINFQNGQAFSVLTDLRTLASSVTDFSTLNLALSRSFTSTGRAIFQGTSFQHKFLLEPGMKNDKKF